MSDARRSDINKILVRLLAFVLTIVGGLYIHAKSKWDEAVNTEVAIRKEISRTYRERIFDVASNSRPSEDHLVIVLNRDDLQKVADQLSDDGGVPKEQLPFTTIDFNLISGSNDNEGSAARIFGE